MAHWIAAWTRKQLKMYVGMMDQSGEVNEDEAEYSEGDSKNKGLKFNDWEGEGNSGSDFFATGEISASGASRGGKYLVIVEISVAGRTLFR